VWWHGRPRQSGQWPDRLVSLTGPQKAEGQTHDPAKAVRLRRAVGGTGKLNDQRAKDALDPRNADALPSDTRRKLAKPPLAVPVPNRGTGGRCRVPGVHAVLSDAAHAGQSGEVGQDRAQQLDDRQRQCSPPGAGVAFDSSSLPEVRPRGRSPGLR
jgi:hypothetical protein